MRLDAIEHAAAHEAARELLDARAARAHARMFLEMVQALQGDPCASVAVPGYSTGDDHWQAHEVVSDWAAGDPTIMVEACRLIAKASNCNDYELRLGAQAWIARIAKMHADYHAEHAE